MEDEDESGKSMKTRVYLGDDGIVRVVSIGDQTPEEMIEVRRVVLNLGRSIPGKVKILNDLSRMGRSLPGSRAEAAQSIKLEKVDKVASYGASTLNRVIASFIMRASGMGNKVRYFETEAEALEWLKE
jgi:UDP-N-acetylmuramyl pentapeptide synthase